LKNMVSTRGRMQVDPKSGMVTVTDAVQNVNAISRFIELQNDTMLRQVVLDVEVLQVDLTQEHASGIDWTIVSNGMGRTGAITASGASMVKPFSGGDPGSIQSVVSRSDGGNVKTLITALEQFGRVSTSYSTVVVTTNRQPVPLGVQNSEAYLASVTAGTVNATTGVSTGATLTASTVSTGFSMVLVPLIMDSNRVLIESTMQVSALREMKNFSSGSGAASNSIQLPSVDSYNTLQRVSVATGDTIVMSGFEREILLRDQTDVVRNFVPGSQRGKTTKQSTVILITPRLQ
jgi:type IVB pilus formation R64 PilN family outer membrane protein